MRRYTGQMQFTKVWGDFAHKTVLAIEKVVDNGHESVMWVRVPRALAEMQSKECRKLVTQQ